MTINATLDRADYLPGETATLTVSTPAGARDRFILTAYSSALTVDGVGSGVLSGTLSRPDASEPVVLDPADAWTLVSDDTATAVYTRELAQTEAVTVTVGQETVTVACTVVPPAPVYGANLGGWRTLGEKAPDAYARILAAFGSLGIVRCWPNGFNTTWRGGLIPTYVWDGGHDLYVNLGSDIRGINTGQYDAAFKTILKSAPTDRQVWFSAGHEPENDAFPAPGAFTIKEWQQAQMRLAKLKTENAPANVRYAPLLMGGSYMVNPAKPLENRYTESASGNQPWTVWFDFDLTNIDAIGTDIYQHGKSDTDANRDSAARVVQPSIAAARKLGKKLIVGELGARNTMSDTGRAAFLADAIAIFNANADVVAAVSYFESDNGALGPWNLLPKPGVTTATMPKSIAVWRAACQPRKRAVKKA